MQESERGKNNFLVKNGRRRRFFPSKLCCFISAQINWSENKKEVSCRNHYIIQLYTWISTDDQQMWFLRQIAWHISSWQNDVSIRLTAELFFVLASHCSANLSSNCYKFILDCAIIQTKVTTVMLSKNNHMYIRNFHMGKRNGIWLLLYIGHFASIF